MASYKDYNNYNEQDKQSLVIDKLGRLKEAIDNMPSGGGGGIAFRSETEDGKLENDIKNFKLPSSITDLGDNALAGIFYKSTSLETVNLSSVKKISGDNVFNKAFDGCSNLKKIDLSGLTEFPSGKNFQTIMTSNTMSSLEEVDFSSVESIDLSNGLSALFYNKKIKKINLSSLKTVTGKGALNGFLGNADIREINLNSLESVIDETGMSSFLAGNANLEEVRFPSLRQLGRNSLQVAFYQCTSLKRVYFNVLGIDPSYSVSSSCFNNLLGGCSGVVLHFAAAAEQKISTLSGYPNFGGTDTVVLFDL